MNEEHDNLCPWCGELIGRNGICSQCGFDEYGDEDYENYTEYQKEEFYPYED